LFYKNKYIKDKKHRAWEIYAPPFDALAKEDSVYSSALIPTSGRVPMASILTLTLALALALTLTINHEETHNHNPACRIGFSVQS